MGKGRFGSPRKRRTREHVIADLSVNHVERRALLCGFAIERVWVDYGIDLFMYTFDRRGLIENDWVLFQVKATDSLKVSADGKTISCRTERADLRYWLKEYRPVILVLYDAQVDIAYWLYVQAHFEGPAVFDLHQAGDRVTVPIPRSQVLDRAAMKRFAGYKKMILKQRGGRIHHVP